MRETLDVRERQQILWLLVKEILVDTQSITIRRSIPIPRQKKVLLREDRQRPNSFSLRYRQPSYLLRRSSYTTLQKHVGLGIQV